MSVFVVNSQCLLETIVAELGGVIYAHFLSSASETFFIFVHLGGL